MTLKVVAIIQARMGSSRLPGKMMCDIAGQPAIGHVISRLRGAKRVDDVWLACSQVPSDDPLAEYAKDQGVSVFRGDENDVLSRFAGVLEKSNADVIVRITGDCPMADPAVVDKIVDAFLSDKVDFVSNTLTRSYPDGLDVEVFSKAALERTDREAKDPFLRAHVTPYMHGRLKDRLPWGEFSLSQVVNENDFSHLRWTLDEADDLEFFRRLLPQLDENYGWMDGVGALTRDPFLLSINAGHSINEGTERDLGEGPGKRHFEKSNAYFERAAKTIPLATQTFSKSYQQWAKGVTPLFIERGRGCRVWDLDGNSYLDYILGLLPVILGHRDVDVDEAIAKQMQNGISFSLASPLEAELAEQLVRLIPCAEMVRFGKNGSDATSAAIRLARAHTGRGRVALCGYHGWHDWYIGTTTRDLGVPDAVKNLSTAFPFNDADALEKLLKDDPNGFAAVILEPDGTTSPTPGFLQRVRQVTEKYGVLLIFDEIVTGFRVDMGGAQNHFGVVPDLAAFGKSMGNGMPISAVTGRAEIMKDMEKIFFSGTFGGEALSLAASLATLKKLEATDTPARLKALGERLAASSRATIQRHKLDEFLDIKGPSWRPYVAVKPSQFSANLVTTLLRQEFVARGLLFASGFNLSLAHDNEATVLETQKGWDGALETLAIALNSEHPEKYLYGELVSPVFQVRAQ